MNTKRISIQIAVIAAVLILCCVFYRRYIGNTCIVVIPNLGFEAGEKWVPVPDNLVVSMEHKGIVEVEKVRIHEKYMEIGLRALRAGQTECTFGKRGLAYIHSFFLFKADRFGSILCNGIYYTGMEAVIWAVGLFLGMVAALFIFNFWRIRGSELYSYISIFIVGLAIFFAAGSAGIFWAMFRWFKDPYLYGLPVALDSIWAIPNMCVQYLTIPMLLFSAAMVISNIELLRHERFRPANILGILIAVIMVAGEALPVLVSLRDWSGSAEGYRKQMLLIQIWLTIYVYFECILAGSVICGLRAARMKVDHDKDFIIILGCRFRKDGTLTPLLRGRCDRAVSFWKEQKEKTGKEAVIIPSGGQGPDECMPEARAMERYLLEEGIPQQKIICEEKSKNTYENMLFSKKIIEEGPLPARTAFATTRYHVFRSGVWASIAGLEAEGIGSSTKWWFWPNAFMRECIGLLANRVRQEIILLISIIAVCIGLMMAVIR